MVILQETKKEMIDRQGCSIIWVIRKKGWVFTCQWDVGHVVIAWKKRVMEAIDVEYLDFSTKVNFKSEIDGFLVGIFLGCMGPCEDAKKDIGSN